MSFHRKNPLQSFQRNTTTNPDKREAIASLLKTIFGAEP
jgi:hypothetical protein